MLPDVPKHLEPRSAPAELAFAALARASSAFRAKQRLPSQVGVRLFRGEDAVDTDGDRLLPIEDDRSFGRWADRVEDLAKPPLGIVADNLHFHSRALFAWARSFLGARVAGRSVELTLFAGNYRATPFGIHQDRLDVFLIGVHGRRTVHLWPPEVSLDRILALRSRPIMHLDAPIRLEVTPGEIAFFPASWWHVVEGCEGISASLSLGLEEEPCTT
jgi:hypothetical protein